MIIAVDATPIVFSGIHQMQSLKDGFADDVTVADRKYAVSLAADSAFEPVVVDATKKQNDFALLQTHLDPGLRVELVLGDRLAFGQQMLRLPVAQGGGGGVGVGGDRDDGGFGADGGGGGCRRGGDYGRGG